MHRNRMGKALPIVINRELLSSLRILTYFKLLVVEIHGNRRARNVIRSPPKNHIWLNAISHMLTDQVHRRLKIKLNFFARVILSY